VGASPSHISITQNGGHAMGTQKKILLVDDDEDLREALASSW
jgi:hypothetical protein